MPQWLLKLLPALGQFLLFLCLVAAVGLIMFFVGEKMGRDSLDWNRFPYKAMAWEMGGAVYLHIAIQHWKDRAPDMSKVVKSTVPKKILSQRNPEHLRQLILETCSAERVHWILVFLSPIFLIFLHGAFGVAAMLIYILGNLPFIVIQRYNRPRLVQLMERQLRVSAERARGAGGSLCNRPSSS